MNFNFREWQNWPVERQSRWVFRMTMGTMVVGLFVGLFLGMLIG